MLDTQLLDCNMGGGRPHNYEDFGKELMHTVAEL